MSFINEKISEEDKNKIDWDAFKAWPSQKHGVFPKYWTIDRDKNFFFVKLSMGRPEESEPSVYAISWRGTVVHIEATVTCSKTSLGGGEVTWDITKLRGDVFRTSDDRTNRELIEVIKGAIAVYQWNYGLGGPMETEIFGI